MKGRALVALAVVVLAGFAPAPFPRPVRRADEGLRLSKLQGSWQCVNQYLAVRDGVLARNRAVREVSIEDDRWTFRSDRLGSVSYRIVVNVHQTPATLDFFRGQQKSPHGTGILRREGNTLHLLFIWDGERPESFERPPSGAYLLELRRPD
jgi:uncharacterized protein (TIGR03067 family)